MVIEGKMEKLGVRFETAYCWDYGKDDSDLRGLYERAKREQWNASYDLDWSIGVDPELETFPDTLLAVYGTELWNKLTPKEIRKYRVESRSWTLSQLLHGEQGALLAASQLVNAAPWMDAKLYGSTQVVDEGRHVEVFDRYLMEKIGKEYPINRHLKSMLDIILTDTRWDIKYVGMQVLVEGLALGVFAVMYRFNSEPLLKNLLKLVMQDEARHVAFGILSLKGYYEQMSETERRDREDFAYESCAIMRDRFIADDVAEEMGMPVERFRQISLECEAMREYRLFLFSRLVPNLKKLGLLTPRMRPKYEALGILRFEDYDPAQEGY